MWALIILLAIMLAFVNWLISEMLKLIERHSKEMGELRFQLFQAESKIAIYEFGMELNKKEKVDIDD